MVAVHFWREELYIASNFYYIADMIQYKTFLIAQVLALRSQAPMRNGPDTGEGLFLSVFLLAYVLPFEFADCLYPVFG